MAEAIGLAASIVGLAGAAASLSLTLYDFVGTVRYAKEEINILAIETSDLSTVLDHLGMVLNQNKDCIIPKTVNTISTLTKRCERLLEQLSVTVNLVKARATHIEWLLRKRKTQEIKSSLEGFKSNLSLIIQTVILGNTIQGGSSRLEKSDQDHKSVTVRRNINILRSAVLSNRRLLEKLNAAESKVNDSRETETEPRDNEGSSSAEENMAGAAFRKELEIANKSQETSVILSYPHETDRNVQLFKAYEALRNDPPASNTLTSSLPISVVSVRTGASRPSGLLTDASKSESISLDKENPTKEIRLLLTEWTDTSPNLVRIYLGDAATDDAAESLPKKPSQEQQRNENANQGSSSRPKTSTNGSNPPKGGPFDESFPLTREAWSPPDHNRKPLIDCFSDRGGGYVWRHEDQYGRWYFVGEERVLYYQIYPPNKLTSPDPRRKKTVVSKQWIAKDVLIEAGYKYADYGQGSFSIPGYLAPQDVRKLHLLASKRAEEILRRLASSEPKKTRHKVKALSDFSAEHPNELAFKKDEIFEVDVQSNGEWWRAFKPDSASGMIPANRVEVISAAAPKPPAEPSPANLTTRPRCKVRALSDFHAGVGARELSFQSGDVIEIEEDLNELRWKGWINGKQGLVLARCVQIIAPAMYSDEQPPSQSVGGFRRTFEKLRATAAASKLAN